MSFNQFIHALRDLIEDWNNDGTGNDFRFMEEVERLFLKYTQEEK